MKPGRPSTTAAGVIVVLLLPACSGLKYATGERPLYTGSTVIWTEPPTHDPRGAKRELEELIQPAANGRIAGMRPAVALHNMIREPEEQKGIRHWLKNKVGSAPVYLDAIPLGDIDRAMVNRLNNRGHFSARCSHEVVPRGRTASVVFTVSPGPAHVISSLTIGSFSAGGIDSAMAAQQPLCPIHAGEPYDLSRLTAERARVAEQLRDQGWYRLRADDLVWAADTSSTDHAVALHLRVKPTTPAIKRLIHTIGRVTVHGDRDDVLPPVDTTVIDGIGYVSYLDMYRPPTILRGVFVRPGDRYSLSRTGTMQRFMNSYGVFRNVLVSHADDSLRPGVLHAQVDLLPQDRYSLFGEMSMVSKSNNFAGPGLRVGFKDRNFLRGAEQFTLDANGRFETQVSGADKGTNAYEIGFKAGLDIPRILLLPERDDPRPSTGTTHIAAGFGWFRRINLYGMRSAGASLSYSWRRDRKWWHDFQLLEVSYNDLYYASDDFQAFLDENPTIQRSFENQFIIGPGYTVTHSTRRTDRQRNWLVYSLGIDESCLLINWFMGQVKGERPEGGFELLGQPYSQYVRLRPELRFFHTVGDRSDQLVMRLLAHTGLAYGNTEVMPYVKQFYAGGTNSLRGFRARSVGPGSYVSPQDDDLLVDQVGDLKLEVNVEFRFTISGYLKGAWFVDAGNIWLLSEDLSRPGGEFHWDTFISETAVNSGFGLRIDPQVIVIRLDVAAPLRRPDLPPGDRWVFDDLYDDWKRNFILNIAIGYPF